MSYVSPLGAVKGNLTVSKDIVTFNPTDCSEVEEIICAHQKSDDEKNVKVSDFYVDIEIFDIYSVHTYLVEFDSFKNFYDVCIDVYLETANGRGKPLHDAHNNEYLLKITFKTTHHYA